MSSFKRGKRLEKLEEVINLYNDARDPSTVTLDFSKWLHTLNTMDNMMEKEKKCHSLASIALNTNDNISGRRNEHICDDNISYLIVLLRYFHKMYVLASTFVPLPLSLWSKWKEGLLTLLWTTSGTDEGGEEREHCRCVGETNHHKVFSAEISCFSSHNSALFPNLGDASTVLTVQKELLDQYRELFNFNLWGCSFMVGNRLFPLLHQLEAKKNLNEDTEEEGEEGAANVEKTVRGQFSDHKLLPLPVANRVDSLWFTELHEICRLCKDSRHLFMEYPHIGQLEREILSNKLENLCLKEEEMMVAAEEGKQENKEKEILLETILRRSFKRDLAVPSIAVENQELETEYKNFEVDDKKELELKKIIHRTAKGPVFHVLSAFYAHLQSLKNTAAENGDPHTFPVSSDDKTMTVPSIRFLGFRFSALPSCLLDEKGNQLADSLVQLWATSSPEECYIAFAFTMQRMIELEAFPAVLNPARVCFLLHLLHQWWKFYTKETHRWGILSTFAAQDDEDAIQFILERHEVILRYALATREEVFLRSGTTPTGNVEKRREASPFKKIEVLRMITQSFIWCLGTYLSHLDEVPMSDAKVLKRQEKAISRCLAWLETYVVGIISVALMNDIYHFADVKRETTVREKETEEKNSILKGKDEHVKGEQIVDRTREDDTVEDLILILEGRLKIALLDSFSFFASLFPAVQEKNQVRLYTIVSSILDQVEKSKDILEPPHNVRQLWTVAFQLLQRAALWLPTRGVGCCSTSTSTSSGSPSVSTSLTSCSTFIAQITWSLKRLLSLASEVMRDEASVDAAADLWIVFSSQNISHPHMDGSPTPSFSSSPSPFPLLLPLPYDVHLRKMSRQLIKSREKYSDSSSGVVAHNTGNTTVDILIERRKSLKRLRSE